MCAAKALIRAMLPTARGFLPTSADGASGEDLRELRGAFEANHACLFRTRTVRVYDAIHVASSCAAGVSGALQHAHLLLARARRSSSARVQTARAS
ncbi:hypothetical protein BN2476_460086 [Paraburkholderia piptadeniae]|uniref:Uncharacterized protein n=1 Tax=Paraburkholderia piptadeniae TaxID=1701573 RepID=A0A1N7SCZ9_9BURK|nr:hypothetical protein BN2476_460086 [Paraburkholderia piptadeniae]